jgi:hypothetical protein
MDTFDPHPFLRPLLLMISRLLLLTLVSCLVYPALAQTTINNASHFPGTSDNTGSAFQPGTEVLHSSPNAGVKFEPAGTFEHVGQFYVAEDGLWNQASQLGSPITGTDYFGYAPSGLGAGLPYQGKGILGASSGNGGQGAGRPTFGKIQLNSTGEFPVVAGMYIAGSLGFNANGPGLSSIITTPNCNQSDSPANAVIFAPTSTITGADHASYIHGFASVSGVSRAFTLPLGDPAGGQSAYHPLRINTTIAGSTTARYVHQTPHREGPRVESIDWISPIGGWLLSTPAGTEVTVYPPASTHSVSQDASLQLVGWNGSQWLTLSSQASATDTDDGYQLTAIVAQGITALAVGLVKQAEIEESGGLTLWPNPTKGLLNVSVANGQTIQSMQVLDLSGHRLLQPATITPTLNASGLASGTYVLEVQTSQGQSLRRRFIRQ